ncbi:MAG: hypothetical protein ABSF44_08910 [Candidatus Bathyarchaeia archaeon]|jgi:hypothetical protein
MSEPNKGIKGEVQNFFCKHYPIPPMAAKSVEISLGSIALKNLHFEDEMGELYANLDIIYIGKSGLACKTPIIKRMREVINDWDKEMAAPVKFTTQGFTEYATGRQRKKGEEGEPIPPHDAGIIIRDEMSRLFKETTIKTMSDTLEFLSELDDCYIESYRTRTYGLEGGKFYYLVLFSASTETFLAKMEDEFFMQGLGNKILWVCDDPPEVIKIDYKTFFLPQLVNEEWQKLKQKIINYMNYLTNLPFPTVMMRDDAAKIWADYKFNCDTRARNSKGKFDGSFIIKLPMKALKLAAIYAALRNNFDKKNMLTIEGKDMQEAINDLGIFEKHRRNVMEWWSNLRRESRDQLRSKSSKYDKEDFLRFASDHGGLCTMSEISAHFDLPSLMQIADVLAMAVRGKYLEVITDGDKQGKFTIEELKRFKPARGSFPQVYKLTKEGKEYLGEK